MRWGKMRTILAISLARRGYRWMAEWSESGEKPETSKPADDTFDSIAALPFANLSGDPEQDYFCEGLAEEILNAAHAHPRIARYGVNLFFLVPRKRARHPANRLGAQRQVDFGRQRTPLERSYSH